MQSTRLPKTNYRDPKRWNTVSVPERVTERAYTRHEVNEDGCWVSTYSTASHGYAQIGWQNKGSCHVVLAHRAAWTHVNGQVPIGMTLDHTCKNRRCVNPAHLRLLSNYENARRNRGDDWAFGSCRNGHPDVNLREIARTAKSGRKYVGLTCGICYRESQKKWEGNNPELSDADREAAMERRRESSRAWYQANKELVKERARVWKQNNKAKPKPKPRALKEIPWEYF